MTQNTSKETRIGLVGLGLMGVPMAKNWLLKKFPVSVLPHKNKKSAEELEGNGAHVCQSIEELVQRSHVVVLMVPTSAEVEEITLGKAGKNGLIHFLKSSQYVIDMSTSDPRSTKSIYEKFNAQGLKFFDSPVTGGVSGAQKAALTLFIGGPLPWFEETKEVLAAVSSFQKHFGEVGNGHVAKIINNFICVGNLAVLSEALSLAASLGINSKNLFETLLAGTACSEMLKVYGPQILENDFQPRFKLAHAYKDLKLAQGLTKFSGVTLPCLEGIVQDLKTANDSKFGEENVSAVIKPIEALLKTKFRL